MIFIPERRTCLQISDAKLTRRVILAGITAFKPEINTGPSKSLIPIKAIGTRVFRNVRLNTVVGVSNGDARNPSRYHIEWRSVFVSDESRLYYHASHVRWIVCAINISFHRMAFSVSMCVFFLNGFTVQDQFALY